MVVKRYRHLGDFVAAGSPLLSMYNPDLLYVEANLEEDRLPGVEPGNPVRIELDAFAEPFQGRVVWVNKSTGAQFALMPRNVVSGEFTRVVQRVPVRIQIERDDRWPRLRAGLSATVAIAHGPGDAAWAAEAARAMRELETRYNALETPGEPQQRRGRRRHGRGGDTMTTLTAAPQSPTAGTGPPLLLEPRHWLAALAILFVFFAPYQTLVQTVITDDAVRLGIEADEYDMTWVTVAYGVGVIYGVFVGLSLSARIGMRYTLVLGMLVFSVGNILCGAATGLVGLALARFVEGFGKMLAMAICRVTLYKQFDRALLVAIGFYGVFAYSTRHVTPLVNAYLDVWLSWRWMYWAYVPVGIVAALLVWRFIRPDRPPQPVHLPIDWLAVTAFVAWIVAIVFAFAWYRKWGGWSSNEFVATVVLCVALPVVLVAWLGLGPEPRRAPEPDPPLAGLRPLPDDARADAPALGGRADDHRHVLHGVARLPANHGGLADGADLGDDGDRPPSSRLGSTAGRCGTSGWSRGSWGRRPACGGCRRSTISHPRSICRSCWPAGGHSSD